MSPVTPSPAPQGCLAPSSITLSGAPQPSVTLAHGLKIETGAADPSSQASPLLSLPPQLSQVTCRVPWRKTRHSRDCKWSPLKPSDQPLVIPKDPQGRSQPLLRFLFSVFSLSGPLSCFSSPVFVPCPRLYSLSPVIKPKETVTVRMIEMWWLWLRRQWW